MKFKEVLIEAINDLYNEDASVDANGELTGFDSNIFDQFPEDILNTLKSHYFKYYGNNFDWNEKTTEFGDDRAGFRKWIEQNEQADFLKNLSKIIHAVRSDLILEKREMLAKKKLDDFEQLIIPVFGNHITGRALSEFEAAAIWYSDATPESIEKAFQDAKNVIDSEGNIDSSKINKSELFPGGEINIPNFERFVEANPEYQKTYDIWYNLFKQHTDLMLQDTNAYGVVGYPRLKKLYHFLIRFEKQNNK